MKKKASFATIFTAAENFHLVKDVGQVPYFMHKTGGYDARLISYSNCREYPFLKKEVNGLKLEFIRNRGKIWGIELGIIGYLTLNSKSIDVLNLFHFQRAHALYLFIYRLLNPKGKAYIKLDMDILFFKDYNAFFYSKYPLKNCLLQGIARWIFKLTNIFSVETEEARSYLLKVYPGLEQKLIVVPNGVDNLYLDEEIKPGSWEEKEDIIITVGRIGTHQKNTELFLEALKEVDLKNWKVYILGPVEESFQTYVDMFYKYNPFLKDRIIFTGNITGRKELFEWYNRAKIFCLTSRFEGFPITFPEALYFGNYIISTPVSSSQHITGNGRTGKVVKAEIQDFAAAIQQSIADGFLSDKLFEDIRKFSRTNFTWPGIIKELTDKLNKDA